MRDWKAYAAEHLSSLRLARARREELAVELSEHLAELYAELLSRGVSEEQAFLKTCAQVGEWKELCEGIFDATKEATMLDRIKQIWVPAAVTFIFGYAALMILDVARARGVMSHLNQQRGLAVYLPWLLLLPFIGAAAAYMSRHARGEGWRVYLAASFPALAFGAVMSGLVALVGATEPQRLSANPAALVLLLVGWVVLPAVALCSGAGLQGLLARRAATQ